ncbi:MAG: hypothetical protein NWE98_02215 [Candidatus Bathyarchaeota archaeon]|nr:hypothetical protein [Candidatus Bathyarchaeota archaeon]
MIISRITKNEIETAFQKINAKYNNNLVLNCETLSATRHRVRIRAVPKKQRKSDDGVKLGYNGRLTAAACWHVHGYFFDELLALQPKTIIRALKRKIYAKNGRIFGNWQDWNCGSILNPKMASDYCMCGKEGVKIGKRKIIISME